MAPAAQSLGGIFGTVSRMTLTIELPDEVYESLRRSPAEVQREMRLAAAIRWYSRGLMSQERAAMVAGLDRTDFLMALAREKVDAFHVDLDQLAREIALE
jgi:predicted HTH domain antitoxin